MLHELRVEPKYFQRIADGSMNFYVADDDHEFQRFDEVELREFDETPVNATTTSPKGFTDSPPLKFTIGYVYSIGSKSILSLVTKKAESNASKRRR